MAKKKANTAKPTKRDEPSISFEESLSEIETIVAHLESGELDLTESLAQYEAGVRRLKQCHSILESAEQKVSVLSGFDVDGNPITEPIPETQFRSAAGHSKTARSKTARSDAGSNGPAGEDNPSDSEDDGANGPERSDRISVDDSPGLF